MQRAHLGSTFLAARYTLAVYLRDHGRPPLVHIQLDRIIRASPFLTSFVSHISSPPSCPLPQHCIVGTNGHAVVDRVNAALHKWCDERARAVEYVIKGNNVLTEHYSALRADVECSDDPRTQFNQAVFDRLRAADRVVVCGQALSHCVAFTMRDLVAKWPAAEAAKLVLLTDCASAVPTFEQV